MKLVLLSGGSGKRLWPLSNDTRSKQFLRVLKGKNNSLESMVQRVWEQIKNVGLQDSALIATSMSQVDLISSQINSQVNVITEPHRRDTFPAIALATSFLHSVENVSSDEVVVILPVDPYVDENFFERIKDLETVLNSSRADMALVGVKPSIPTSKYGYIVPDNKKIGKVYQNVSHFIEKPDELKAKELIEQGAYWNCGVFAFKVGYLINLLENKGVPTNYFDLKESYDLLPKISFDYEVVEKTENIVVIPYDGSWKDLGTWNTLTEEMATKQIGKGIICEKSTNTHLINELDIPVTVLGVSNAVVAVSADGILVSDKQESPRVKEMLEGHSQRPMFEERRWGWYRVLDHVKFDNGQEVLTKRIGISAGKNLSYQKHYHRSEVWTIIRGEGEFVLNDKIHFIKPGDVLNINVEDKHAIRALTDLEIIEVQQGNKLVEEDIVRILMTWEEIEEFCLKQRVL